MSKYVQLTLKDGAIPLTDMHAEARVKALRSKRDLGDVPRCVSRSARDKRRLHHDGTQTRTPASVRQGRDFPAISSIAGVITFYPLIEGLISGEPFGVCVTSWWCFSGITSEHYANPVTRCVPLHHNCVVGGLTRQHTLASPLGGAWDLG